MNKSNHIESRWTPILKARLLEKAPLIQILIGPRQVGKTTSLGEIAEDWRGGRI